MSIWKGLTAFITGGAGALGNAVVNNVIKGGGRAAIFDLALSTEKSVLKSLETSNAMFIRGDVSSESDVEGAIERTSQKFGQIHVCVSCAGISAAFGIMNPNKGTTCSSEDAFNVLNVNLIGTFNVNRLVAKHMCQYEDDGDGERGVLINTSGFCDKGGWLGQSITSASMNGISEMTLPMSQELSPEKIRVCTISPGLFRSHYVDDLPEDVHDYLLNCCCHPLRFGKPNEYAKLVESIVENRMLNGVTIKLDAGLRLASL